MVYKKFEIAKENGKQVSMNVRDNYKPQLVDSLNLGMGCCTDYYDINDTLLICRSEGSMNSSRAYDLIIGGSQSSVEAIVEKLDLKNLAEESE